MEQIQRLSIVIRGAVQGVGFRPFIFRLAKEIKVNGWVLNSSQGVFIEIEGTKDKLELFLLIIEREKPALSYIQSMEASYLGPLGYEDFQIKPSEDAGEKTALVLPDIATCPECLREIFDPTNRRHFYPFTNCTHCGPRYSIIESLPYDRPNTAMKIFPMCEECEREYHDPLNRRFHAQPNACPSCGPQLRFHDEKGKTLGLANKALNLAVQALKKGNILAVKGIGGFHLMVDARSKEAVSRLRRRKRRDEKPFAVMIPALEKVKRECRVSPAEERLLQSPEAPIVLLKRRLRPPESEIAENIAPNNPTLGVMLPYSPLHHLLTRMTSFPLVATSGNISDEPICLDGAEALKKLKGIADLFLVHNRPIVRQVDDSIVQATSGREMILRRSRGYAPLPINLKDKGHRLLATGAHQKNSIALQIADNAIVSQHIGDLETEEAFSGFQKTISSLTDLFQTKPSQIVCDLHPDYLSTQYAKDSSASVVQIQHHHAHIASCMAENHLEPPVLGVAWDGTGWGTDGTIWGGEFLLIDRDSFKRIMSFRPFRLPGASRAIKEPRRAALGALFEIFGPRLFDKKKPLTLKAFKDAELKVMKKILTGGFNSPQTTSVGRLFDAVASIIGIRQIASFEGQAAMELEFAADKTDCDQSYPFIISEFIDWIPLVKHILNDIKTNIETNLIAAKFHNTLAQIVVEVCRRQADIKKIAVSGGCFQNRRLTELVVAKLKSAGFQPYQHQRVPPNDGGISLGQLYAANLKLK